MKKTANGTSPGLAFARRKTKEETTRSTRSSGRSVARASPAPPARRCASSTASSSRRRGRSRRLSGRVRCARAQPPPPAAGDSSARTPSPGTTTGSHAELPRPPTARAASRASHRRVACRARWERPARRTAPASSLCAGARSHAGPLSRGRSAVPGARESPSSAPPGSSTPPRRSRSPPHRAPRASPGLTAVSTRISNAALIRPVRSPTRVPSRWPRPRPCGAGPAGASRCRSADVVLRTEQRSTRSQELSFRRFIAMTHPSTPRMRWCTALAVSAFTCQVGAWISSMSAVLTSETSRRGRHGGRHSVRGWDPVLRILTGSFVA